MSHVAYLQHYRRFCSSQWTAEIDGIYFRAKHHFRPRLLGTCELRNRLWEAWCLDLEHGASIGPEFTVATANALDGSFLDHLWCTDDLPCQWAIEAALRDLLSEGREVTRKRRAAVAFES